MVLARLLTSMRIPRSRGIWKLLVNREVASNGRILDESRSEKGQSQQNMKFGTLNCYFLTFSESEWPSVWAASSFSCFVYRVTCQCMQTLFPHRYSEQCDLKCDILMLTTTARTARESTYCWYPPFRNHRVMVSAAYQHRDHSLVPYFSLPHYANFQIAIGTSV